MGWWCASRIPYAPNGWNIYRPTFGIQFMVNVGKYSIHGINMGIGISYEHVPWNFMDLILLQWWWYHYINFVANHHDIGNAWDLTNSANFAGSGSFQSCHGPTVDVYEIRLTTWDVWNLVKSRLKLVFFCNVFSAPHTGHRGCVGRHRWGERHGVSARVMWVNHQNDLHITIWNVIWTKHRLFRVYRGLPSLKLTARPWKLMVGRLNFLFGMACSQGLCGYVSFRECILPSFLGIIRNQQPL